MPESLFPEKERSFAASRCDALRQLEAFVPAAGRYARHRNHVVAGHTNVSRLSPAIRHRLLLESECAAAPLRRYAPSTVEKFTQEVYWRRYWKSWLSLRPQVWTDYLSELDLIRSDASQRMVIARADRCEAGESSVAIMNHFARELVETGYLHNHARMWFAGWWIHVERLPWQLGAEFFRRHLLDGDPASNTLSWRWVAGLQTPGKTYLPRRSNLEKYLPPELLAEHSEGLGQLDKPAALKLQVPQRPAITRKSLPASLPIRAVRTGIWLHEEDLFIEESPLSEAGACCLLATGDPSSWHRYPASKVSWLKAAMSDGAKRAGESLRVPVELKLDKPLIETLAGWAKEHRLEQIVAMRPEVGPLNDQLPGLERRLEEVDVTLHLVDRPEDLEIRPLATAGFFVFWKKMQKRLGEPALK